MSKSQLLSMAEALWRQTPIAARVLPFLLAECRHVGILDCSSVSDNEFANGIRGNLHVTFEEGTWAAWLNDLRYP